MEITKSRIIAFIVFLVIATVAVLIPGFIAIGKCGSFGAAYTGCLMGPQCACTIASVDSQGQQTQRCMTTTHSGCMGFQANGKDLVFWAGDSATGKCTAGSGCASK
jgi:hypothetical protein